MQTVERLPPTASAEARKAATKQRAAGKTVSGVGEVMQQEGGEEQSNGAAVVSSERAFADYVFGSLILHGFCVNFIN